MLPRRALPDSMSHRSFEAVERYNRFVRKMKIGLATAAVLLAALILIWPVFSQREPGFTLAFSELQDFDDTLRMKAPRFVGADSRGRLFAIEAQSAYQPALNDEEIFLDTIVADVKSNIDSWIVIDAPTGVFRQHDEALELSGQVNVFSNLGYEIHGRQLRLNLREGIVISEQTVFGQGPFGVFEAGALDTDVEGSFLLLHSGVKMTIYPKNAQ